VRREELIACPHGPGWFPPAWEADVPVRIAEINHEKRRMKLVAR